MGRLDKVRAAAIVCVAWWRLATVDPKRPSIVVPPTFRRPGRLCAPGGRDADDPAERFAAEFDPAGFIRSVDLLFEKSISSFTRSTQQSESPVDHPCVGTYRYEYTGMNYRYPVCVPVSTILGK